MRFLKINEKKKKEKIRKEQFIEDKQEIKTKEIENTVKNRQRSGRWRDEMC